jgi:hypothetical protein
MKSLFGLIGLAFVGSCFGQGTVNFSNATSAYGSAVPDHLVRWSDSAPGFNHLLVPGGLVSSNYAGLDLTGLRAQLYYGASTNGPASRWWVLEGSF